MKALLAKAARYGIAWNIVKFSFASGFIAGMLAMSLMHLMPGVTVAVAGLAN